MLDSLKISSVCIITTVFLLSGIPTVVFAQDSKPDVTIGVGLRYDDNVFREEHGGKSDTVLFYSGNVGYGLTGDWYRLNLNYSANENRYLEDSYQGNQVVNGQSKLIIGKAGHWFSWFISDREQSTVIDVLNPDTPNNRSQRSIYSTGPQISFKPSALDTLQASYMYTKVNVADSLADTTTTAGSLSYSRKLSKTSTASINLSRTEIEPDVDTLFFLVGANQYQQDRASLSISQIIKNGMLSANYGTAKLNGLKGITSTSSEEYSLSGNRKFDIGSFELSFSKSVSDSGIGAIEGFLNNSIGSQEFDIQENNLWAFNYQSPQLPGRVNVSFTSSKSEAASLTQERAEKRKYNVIGVNHKLSKETTISASVVHHTNSSSGDGESKTLNYSIGLNHQVNKRLGFSCSANEESGTGDRSYDVFMLNCNINWRIY